MSTSGDDRELALVLHELIRRYQLQDPDRVCEFGITTSECHALEQVVIGGPVSVNQIGAILGVNKSTASRLLQSLADKKFVRHEADRNDGRAWRVVATAAGKRIWQQIVDDTARRYETALSGLSERERETTLAVLRKLSSIASGNCGT